MEQEGDVGGVGMIAVTDEDAIASDQALRPHPHRRHWQGRWPCASMDALMDRREPG
jgi:hypothetical protein